MAGSNGNGNGTKAKPGRPSVYDEKKHCEAALLSCAEGATWPAIAKQCGVAVDTVMDWSNPKSPRYRAAFSEAVTRAKQAADEIVVGSLFQRACGAVVTIEESGPNGTRSVERREAPDTRACEVWLFNRMRGEWCSVQKIEVTGADGGPITHADASDREKLQAQAAELIGEVNAALAGAADRTGAGTG